MEQHLVPVDIENLHNVPLHAPRKTFWDWLPVWFCEWYLKRGWHNPKPTRYEEWVISSIILRSKYKQLTDILGQMARTQNELERAIEQQVAPFLHKAGPKKVNPEDLN